MGRFVQVWLALQPRQRLIVTLGLVAIAATIYGLVQATRSPSMEMLYAGLDQSAASEVASAVQGMNVPMEVRGDAIYVGSADRDRVRMALAAAGLPRNGPEGYELLDELDGFGTTSEMFAATYWRAKEGELARTILASPGVRSARVHIANPAGRPFQRSARPSASITVSMGQGGLDPSQAEAMRFLVASAVSGLAAEDVSVIDSEYGAVLRAGETLSGQGGQSPGSAREVQLRAEIERLLAARVGEGRAIVTVAVETTGETQTTVERLIDPDSRIAISTDTREIEDQGTGGGGGAATVASNLPVEGGAAGSGSSRSRTETEERINFEVSETRIERVRRAGEVSRITVAVLVDGIATTDTNGERTWAPRPESEVEQLRDLVRSAIGYDEERGDVVTVETLEFAPRQEAGTIAVAGMANFFGRNAMMLAQIGALTAVALGLALFVVQPLLKAAEAQAPPPVPERLPPSLDLGASSADDDDEETDPIALLKNAFVAQREDSASVLRSWLERDVQDRMAEEQEEA